VAVAAIICAEQGLLLEKRLAPALLPMDRLMTVLLPAEDQLRTWIRQSLDRQQNILATSNQGTVLLYQQDGYRLIIKTAMGRGLMLWIRQRTLQREFRAYRQLEGVAGIPACYGLLDQRYLLLEQVTGHPYRDAEITDREGFFEQLLQILNAIHARKVAHGDLKSKGNLMVTDKQQPCVIDFGTAFRLKPGFHPINNWFFRTAKRLDLNAWVKHKYQGHYSNASPEDAKLLHYSWLEILVRKISGRPMERVFSRSDAVDD
jgi:serine/threonine protein kinase